MVSFFIGSILNGILTKILKKLLNQDRPDDNDDNDDDETEPSSSAVVSKPGDKGMPSSHGASLGFIGVIVALEAYSWGVAAGLVLYVFAALRYRITERLHTLEQVLVGLALGVANGIIWRSLIRGHFPLLPSINIGEAVSTYLLPPDGVLPIPYLLLPAMVGAAVVGSFERRIGRFLSKRLTKGKKES